MLQQRLFWDTRIILYIQVVSMRDALLIIDAVHFAVPKVFPPFSLACPIVIALVICILPIFDAGSEFAVSSQSIARLIGLQSVTQWCE